MSDFGIYLIEASICMGVIFLCLRPVIGWTSFHDLNRFFLLFLLLLAMGIPLVQFDFPEEFQKDFFALEDNLYQEITAGISSQKAEESSSTGHSGFWVLIYLLGAGVALSRFLWQLGSIWLVKRKSQKTKYADNVLFLYEGSEAFSFFQWIFIPKPLLISLNCLPS